MNAYPAYYLKLIADKYIPPTEKDVIDSVVNSITICALNEANNGKYTYELSSINKRLMLQSRSILQGVLNELTKTLKYDVELKNNKSEHSHSRQATDDFTIIVDFSNSEKSCGNIIGKLTDLVEYPEEDYNIYDVD